MNFSKRRKSIVDFIFIIALFGAFAITGLLVVVFGARVYESTVSKMDENYAQRTALSYVTEKIRSHDMTNGADTSDIRLTNRGDDSQLILRDRVNGKDYLTYMYVDDGYLKEYTTSADRDFNYDQGTNILKINEFKANRVSDSLFRFDIEDSFGEKTSFYVTLYSGTNKEEADE